MLVLLDGFDAHPLSRQQSLIAWGITRWGHELEVSMTTTKEEPSSEVTETESIFYLFYKDILIYNKKKTLWHIELLFFTLICSFTMWINKMNQQKTRFLITLKIIFNKQTYLTPAEKLITGKKRPSTLKFSNMPWTGWPLIRKEILGTLRSKQQLTTSSAARVCALGEATWRGTVPERQSTEWRSHKNRIYSFIANT